ncbi:MAG: hypothetical protein U0R50_01520 [Gaiellales bacterium]
MDTKRHRGAWAVLGLVAVVALALGLGASQAARGGKAATPLSKTCGSKLVVQTDWFPEPEHAALYQFAGVNGSIDKEKGRYTGTVQGVQIEIRAGGPYTGFQQPISQMYQDASITLGYVNSDEAVQLSKKLPTVAIVAPLEFSPQILMWNPEKLNITKFSDIQNKYPSTPVVVFAGGVWVDYLVGRGWVNKAQVDSSYDGSPTRFVAKDGAILQQGFVTSEPYQYKNDIKQYGKDVAYLLIKNSGYVPYPEPLAATPAVLKAKDKCFKLLVPLIQKAQVAYMKNPGPVNAKLVDIVKTLATFWVLSPEGNAYNVATQRKLGIVQNGPNCTLGDFNMKRLQGVINQTTPIYEKGGLDTYVPGLKAAQIATNKYIDPKIHLKTTKCK